MGKEPDSKAGYDVSSEYNKGRRQVCLYICDICCHTHDIRNIKRSSNVEYMTMILVFRMHFWGTTLRKHFRNRWFWRWGTDLRVIHIYKSFEATEVNEIFNWNEPEEVSWLNINECIGISCRKFPNHIFSSFQGFSYVFQ